MGGRGEFGSGCKRGGHSTQARGLFTAERQLLQFALNKVGGILLMWFVFLLGSKSRKGERKKIEGRRW